MLSDPEGNFERMGDCDKARHKSHMHTERRKWRRGWRKLKLDKSHRTTPTSLIDKGPPGRIVGYDSRLCMFSYYQMDRNNINKCHQGGQRGDDNSIPDATESAMIFTEYYASTYFSASKIFWLKIPKEPPKGFCSSSLVLLATISIFLSMTTIAAIRLSRMKPNKRRRRRVRKRSAEAIARIRLRKIERKSRRLLAPEGEDDKISIWSDCKVLKGETVGASPLEGESIRKAFTTSFADADLETLNTQVPFDTDSIFFVCDNSATGHICNDIRKFVPGSIRSTARRLTTANGTGAYVQEGTVRVHLTDDDGTRHVFVLENCIYLPESPVNLLSTRRLAEKFLDTLGNPDEETNITSRYSTHVLTWCFGKYKKTFPTPVSGLPELLFDEGFGNFSSYCTEVGSPIPTYSFLGSQSTIPSLEEGLDANAQYFMSNETIKYKDGNGTFEHVTYNEPVKIGESVKHRITREDEKQYIVDGIFLSPLAQPELSGVPISIEQYASQLPNLTREQLHEIAHPEILDDAQRELMSIHCKLNHLPFPQLIKMAENGHIKKSLAKLKERVPICMSCVFGMSHRRPWRSKGAYGSIRKDTETDPGDCVSMDQLVSAQPGLISQMSGYLTNLRIWGATIFVDHVSDYVYVALMRNLTLEETLLAKTAFERHAQDGGVRIREYRADNGRFADQGFRDALNECNQNHGV